MSPYFENVEENLTNCNRKSVYYGNYKAWDNAKGKNCRKFLPRGRVYHRLQNLGMKASLRDIREAANNCVLTTRDAAPEQAEYLCKALDMLEKD